NARRGKSGCVRLHRALLQSQTPALDDRLYESDGVRTAGGISLGGCQRNRVQARGHMLTEWSTFFSVVAYAHYFAAILVCRWLFKNRPKEIKPWRKMSRTDEDFLMGFGFV